MEVDDKLFIEDESLYHSQAGKPYLSSHLLAEFRRCPFIYSKVLAKEHKQPDSDAFALGRAFHTLVLEGEPEFKKRFEWRSPVNSKTGSPYGDGTKAYKEWSTITRQQGLEPVSADQAELSYRMADSIQNHEGASELLERAQYRERVARQMYAGHFCQIRIDACGEDVGIVDLKSCKSLDSFTYDAKKFGYNYQLAFYDRVLELTELGFASLVHIIAVEKVYPYRCGVWEVPTIEVEEAQEENEMFMRELHKCLENNNWPTRFEETRSMAF